MKKTILFILAAVLTITSLAGCGKNSGITDVTVDDVAYYEQFKDEKISINVYNWGEYISDGSEADILNTNAAFEKLTGIKVNYTTYSTNEEMYSKIKGGGTNYDIIIPSDYMISRMIKEDMLSPLDYSKIPNFEKYTMDTFKNPVYDPENKFSVPYMWGTVGIIYNKNMVDEEDFDWDILWDKKYKGNILMFNNPRDAFGIAEILSGYSINTENPDELKEAAKKLKEQKGLVQAYVMDEIFDKMGAEEAALAPYYAGDAVTLMEDYDFLGFTVPKSGTNRFVDALCIPKSSKNVEAAQMYINFMLETEVAHANSDYIGYSTPHTGAYELIDEDRKNDGFSYPSDEYLNSKTTVYYNLSDDANQLMQDLWTDMMK